ncbi:MAG TPA: nicotinamide riboside transporter PnuC [Pseudonocardiaceae bacterium]
MLGWLNTPALYLGDVATSRGEILGFLTGVLTVWLVVRRNIWNWPLGIANVLLLMLLFRNAGLYADAALQPVYVVLGLYGWWAWLAGGTGRSGLRVARTSRREWMALAAGGVLVTAAIWQYLDHATGSTVPLADAVTTGLSLVATYGQCRRLVESWWFWIAADLIYIPLYLYKGLALTAVLYVVFLGLCVLGVRAWYAALRPSPVPA